MRWIMLIGLFISAASGYAQSPRVLTFRQWKDKHVIEAENRVARASNRLTLARHDGRPESELQSVEEELKGALEALEITKEFTIDHYVATYFIEHANSRSALLELTASLTAEELADLLAAVVRERSHGDALVKATTFNPPTASRNPAL